MIRALLLPLLLGCPGDPDGAGVCDPARPAMTLSEAEVDFGEVALEGAVVQTVSVANEGDLPLGVTSVAIGDEADGSPFHVAFDIDATPCAWVPGPEFDPEPPPPDTGGPVTDDPDSAEPDTPRGHAFVLDPGCVLPLAVTFAPEAPGDLRDALVVRSSPLEDVDGSGFRADALHGTAITWLRGTAPGVDLREDPYVVGNVIQLARTSMLERETLTMTVRAHSPVGSPIAYRWSTDEGGGTLSDGTLPEAAFTAFAIVTCGAPDDTVVGSMRNVYFVLFDEHGNQDWSFDRVAVWNETAPLYDACPDIEASPSGGCDDEADPDCPVEDPECGGDAALSLFALGALASRRRRRDP